MTLSITKREVLSQVKYNLKVESMRRKNIGQKPMSKLFIGQILLKHCIEIKL